jgi:hypothetical protein
MPRSKLREVSRLHSAGVKMLLGSTRATIGMAAPLAHPQVPWPHPSRRRFAPPQDEVQIPLRPKSLMVTSAATPRVSNHVGLRKNVPLKRG